MNPLNPGRVIWALIASVVALCAVPSAALATLDVYFQVQRYKGGDGTGQIRAENFEGTLGPSSCNPSVADCRSGPPTTLSLERGGAIVATSDPSDRPAIAMAPQAGDVVHVAVNGAERAAVAYDGRPVLDNGCVPSATTVAGNFTAPPGATVEAHRQLNFDNTAGEAGSVTVDGDRWTAAFASSLDGYILRVDTAWSQTAADGSPVGVHSRNWSAFPCAPVRQTVQLHITGPADLHRLHVDSHGGFELPTRAACAKELGSCLVDVKAFAARSGRGFGPSLGDLSYSVPGGTNSHVHGRLTVAARKALRKRGTRRADFSVVVAPPPAPPPGFTAVALHSAPSGTLVAP